MVCLVTAILRNEIGWFDDLNNTSPMLTGRLQSDATLLQTITVDRTAILLHNVGLVVTSFIIAFILNWRITLVVIATYPLLISGHISEVSFLSRIKYRIIVFVNNLMLNHFMNSETLYARLWWQLEQSIFKG